MRRRVYIANTGGTIGMKKTPAGYAPAAGYLQSLMARIPELSDPLVPEYVVGDYAPLLDSSNMTPDDWLKIATDIDAHYEDFDGFVVLHGTDTMAYTASALPFMLDGLAKPVILTGSQITALLIAADPRVTEVCLYFGGKLLRGCRTEKVNADGFDAFASPNFPPLGVAGIDIEIDYSRMLPPSRPSFQLLAPMPGAAGGPSSEPVVAALRIFPGISATILRNVLQPPLRGLVLEAYGVGNAPDRDQDLLAALQDATSRGLVIVACTQCLRGTVDLGDYATGSALAKAGVVSGFDLTAEAALAKMFHLFHRSHDAQKVKRLMQVSLRGELTPPRTA